MTELLNRVGTNQGPLLLSAGREVEDFALRYAEIHLNDPNKALTFRKDATGS